MDQREVGARTRLGLLLAGAGTRCRRLLAEPPGPGEELRSLAVAGIPRRVLDLAGELAEGEARRLLERIVGRSWRWVIPGDTDYPPLLEHVADPPLGLFMRGRVEWRHVVAVVGSRKATAYGRKVARLVGEELARSGVVVASGMARGVDAAAHHGALAGGGQTVAVWGTGPDEVYPREHVELAEAIAATGVLLTEYPPGTPPRRHHFPQRNRILAGLAEAVVVVEAAARSGALVTARLALDEGREVFAVPGSIFSDVSLGPNALLRLGAQPLLVPRDVLDAVGVAAVSAPPRGADELDGILQAGDELTVDELARLRGVDIQEMLATLLELELAGAVERLPDGRYCRR